MRATNSRFQPVSDTVTGNAGILLNLTLAYTGAMFSAWDWRTPASLRRGPPGIGPDLLEDFENAGGRERALLGRHAFERVEAERLPGVRDVAIDQVGRPLSLVGSTIRARVRGGVLNRWQKTIFRKGER